MSLFLNLCPLGMMLMRAPLFYRFVHKIYCSKLNVGLYRISGQPGIRPAEYPVSGQPDIR